MATEDHESKPVAGDDSLGLELLEDGGFRIHGMEFQNQELRPVKMRGVEIERIMSPESVLMISKEQVSFRYVYRDGLWFKDQQGSTVARTTISHPTVPTKCEASNLPDVLIHEPTSLKFEEDKAQFTIIGNRDGFADELLARYVAHFRTIAAPEIHAGRSRFDDKQAGNRCTVFFRVVNEDYWIMHMVTSRFIAHGDVCTVLISGAQAWSREERRELWPHFFSWISWPLKIALGLLINVVLFCLLDLRWLLFGLSAAMFCAVANAVAYLNDRQLKLYLDRYTPKELIPAAKGKVMSARDRVISFNYGSWNIKKEFSAGSEDIAQIRAMTNLARIALQRTCADLGLKADDVKEGAS